MTIRLLASLIILISSWGVANNAYASSVQEASPQSGSTWIVESTDQECHLQRQFSSATGSFWVALIKGGGPEQIDLLLAGEGVPKVRAGRYFWVGMESRGQSRQFSAIVGSGAKQQGQVLLVQDIPSRMLGDFETDQVLALSAKNSPILNLHLAESRESFAKLEECYANLLRKWNVDASNLAMPVLMPGRSENRDYGNQGSITAQRSDLPKVPDDADAWIRWSDFPTQALLQEVSGTVVVALSVSPSGEATGCDVVISSKFAPLDEQTCHLMLARARYQPTDAGVADKRPRRAVERVRWVIPTG